MSTMSVFGPHGSVFRIRDCVLDGNGRIYPMGWVRDPGSQKAQFGTWARVPKGQFWPWARVPKGPILARGPGPLKARAVGPGPKRPNLAMGPGPKRPN